MEESVVDGFRCILRHHDKVCDIIEAIEAIEVCSEIPKTLCDGSFSVRSISEGFLHYCLEHSIMLPYFVTQIFPASFSFRRTLSRVEIPRSIEIIANECFHLCSSLREVIFASASHLREFGGFSVCASLCRIEIPSSVEIITHNAFFGCESLQEAIFSSDSHLRELHGFNCCTSLCRINIPSSVEIITHNAFFGCKSLQEVIFPSDSHLRELHGFGCCIKNRDHKEGDNCEHFDRVMRWGMEMCMIVLEWTGRQREDLG
jgi:hypothetical protein